MNNSPNNITNPTHQTNSPTKRVVSELLVVWRGTGDVGVVHVVFFAKTIMNCPSCVSGLCLLPSKPKEDADRRRLWPTMAKFTHRQKLFQFQVLTSSLVLPWWNALLVAWLCSNYLLISWNSKIFCGRNVRPYHRRRRRRSWPGPQPYGRRIFTSAKSFAVSWNIYFQHCIIMSTDRGHTVTLLLPRYHGLTETFMRSENYLCDLRGLMSTQGRPTICDET